MAPHFTCKPSQNNLETNPLIPHRTCERQEPSKRVIAMSTGLRKEAKTYAVAARQASQKLMVMQVSLNVYIFQPSDEGPMEAETGDDDTSPYCEWQLPAQCFCGLWDSLLYGQVQLCILFPAGTKMHQLCLQTALA